MELTLIQAFSVALMIPNITAVTKLPIIRPQMPMVRERITPTTAPSTRSEATEKSTIPAVSEKEIPHARMMAIQEESVQRIPV